MLPPTAPWPALAGLPATPLASGLINATWRLDGPTGPVAAVQRLNTRIFDPVIHEDIEAVTRHLAHKGLVTPRLVHTAAHELFHVDDAGGVWRALTWVGTRTVERVGHPSEAEAAGRLVGRFHAAVDDLDWRFRNPRTGVHDTARHAATLLAALDAHPQHRLHAQVATLAGPLLARWKRLHAELPVLPARVVHGDLKISNLRFDGAEAVALVDLDTLQRDTLGSELGDALRSWCGTAGEDVAEARFDLDVLEAAVRGYATGAAASPPPPEAWAALVPSVARIANELAMRFAADALNEAYFGWDRARFPQAGEHNLVRAAGQASLAAAVERTRGEAERRVVQVANTGRT